MKYKNIEKDQGSGDTDTDTQKTKMYTLMFNQNIDTVTIGNIVTPYVTAGLGLGRLNPSSIHNAVDSAGIVTTSTSPMKKTTNLVWQVGVGTSFKITEMILADVNIKRVDYGSIKHGDNTKVKLRANEFSGGLKFNF
jgi:opacity protein-like surface antigen